MVKKNVVHVFIECLISFYAGDSDECTQRFLNFNDIDETSSTIVAFPSDLSGNVPFNFVQWIFPNIRFTCNGYVTTWRLRVNNSMETENTLRPIPQITTWRLAMRQFGNNENYMPQSNTTDSQATMKMDGESVYYEYTPSSPTSVQAGDIVGIMMPNSDDERMRSARPLFLMLPQGNSSTISCVSLRGSQLFQLQNRMCPNPAPERQSQYIPLLSAILSEIPNNIYHLFHYTLNNSLSLDRVTPSSESPSPTATVSSTQSSITVVPSPSAIPATSTPQGIIPTTELADPSESGSVSDQLAGVIVGALLAAVALVLIVVLVIFLILLLRKRRGQKLYDVPVPPQPQNMDNPVYTGR